MSIEGIFLATKASGPIQSLQQGTLLQGSGLEGDRYAKCEGTYSVGRISKLRLGEREPGRQLTLISADSVERALDDNDNNNNAEKKRPASLGDLRRNIVVRGLSAEQLLAAIGHVVALGDTCRVLVHRHCVPCLYNERKNGIPGLMNAIWNESGVSCQVLTGGTISVGDKVTIVMETDIIYPIDEGNQSPGYFIPPSQRTAEMVKKALEIKRQAKKRYQEIDPEGVARAAASYASVGMTYWPPDRP